MVFLELRQDPGVYSRVPAGTILQSSFVQRGQDSFLVTRDTSGISSRLDRAIWTLLLVRRETQGPYPVATVILGSLSIFSKHQASSHFEALNSACLSRCQRDVRPLIEMRR